MNAAAGEVLFYHFTARPLEAALPDLLERTLARGWRAVVRCGSAARVDALNRLLWSYREDSFLPHGGKADPEPARQPVYLTDGSECPNAPDVLFLVDGAAAAPDELIGFARACVLFNGDDPAAVQTARALWKAVVGAEAKALYWAQEPSGKWVKKAEAGGEKR